MVVIKSREWLRATDVQNDDQLEIVDEGRYLKSSDLPFSLQGRKSIFEISVKLSENTVKPWLMNRTTQRRCADAWGEETKNWINKYLRVSLKKQDVNGKIRAVIYGIPISGLIERPNDIEEAFSKKRI